MELIYIHRCLWCYSIP